MGTKKGMKRKTARRAYKKKARRKTRGMKSVSLFGLKVRVPRSKASQLGAFSLKESGGFYSKNNK